MGLSKKAIQQSGKMDYSLLTLLISVVAVVGGCAYINIVNNNATVKDGVVPEALASTPSTSETSVSNPASMQCGEMVLPEPVVVKELPATIRNILLTDPDKGVIMMANQIAEVRKAYFDYRTAVNVAYLEFRRSCKK